MRPRPVFTVAEGLWLVMWGMLAGALVTVALRSWIP